MSSLARRITAGLGANAFSQATTTVIQLVSLPLFLHVWDASTYGRWLLLSTIPAYIGMADVGMVTAAANSMTMATGRGDLNRARVIYQSTIVFTVSVCLAVGVLASLVIGYAPIDWLGSRDDRIAMIALTLGMLATILGGLDQAVFRATGRYGQGSALTTLTRIAEFLATLGGLWFGGSFAAVAMAATTARIVSLVAVHRLANQGGHGLQWGWTHARWDEIRALARPALSFMAFPVATALTLQGTTLAVGHLFGTAAVALFNTYRTVARVAIQLITVISWSVEPELSRLYGQGGLAAVRDVYRRSSWACGALTVTLALALYLSAPWLLQWWTHGQIPFDAATMAALLAYAAAAGLSQMPRMLLMATNQHGAFALWSLVHAGIGLAAAYALGHAIGLPGAGLSMLINEALVALTCVFLVRRLAQRAPAAAAYAGG